MKTGKLFYLWVIIIVFIILWIPYFENITTAPEVTFFGVARGFVSLYPILLFLGVIEGALIMLYLRSLIQDMKKSEPQKFDL